MFASILVVDIMADTSCIILLGGVTLGGQVVNISECMFFEK